MVRGHDAVINGKKIVDYSLAGARPIRPTCWFFFFSFSDDVQALLARRLSGCRRGFLRSKPTSERFFSAGELLVDEIGKVSGGSERGADLGRLKI